MNSNLNSALIDLKQLHTNIKSHYLASSRLTNEIKTRKWYEKMANSRSNMQLDIEDLTGKEHSLPSEEIERTKSVINHIRENLPDRYSDEREIHLADVLKEKEKIMHDEYHRFLNDLELPHETEVMLKKHDKLITYNIQKLIDLEQKYTQEV